MLNRERDTIRRPFVVEQSHRLHGDLPSLPPRSSVPVWGDEPSWGESRQPCDVHWRESIQDEAPWLGRWQAPTVIDQHDPAVPVVDACFSVRRREGPGALRDRCESGPEGGLVELT